MKSSILTSCLLLASLQLLFAQNPSDFIHLDQFGYRPGAEKVAVITDPKTGQNSGLSFSPGTTMEVRDAVNNTVVWSGEPALWNNGNEYLPSGDAGWWLDFSDLTTPGNYYLIDPASGERTGTFTIGEAVYADVLKDAGRMFYYNRCNAPKAAPYAETGWTDPTNFLNPLQDADCSDVNDRENASRRRDLSGGWFDAGDYNKYVTFAQPAVDDLLWAYTESGSAFTDDWNIPESGNGIPDLLDEIKWEIDWLRKMVNPDGSVIIKMGNIDFGTNDLSPPSINTGRRYYGPTCTSASIAAAAMLAQAAKVFAEVPAWSTYASEIGAEAETAFAYWLAASDAGSLETNCDDGTIKAGDADRSETEQKEIALTAAVHLFDLTGTASYNDYVRDNLYDAEYMNGGWWGPYKNYLTSALTHYVQLTAAHPQAVSNIRTSMTPHVRDDWNGFYGFNEAGLYRAYMPESSYHWGSNSIVSSYANLNRMMARAGIVDDVEADFNRKANGMAHYIHGVNPLGLVYMTGMEGRGAERGIQEVYHNWFAHGTDWDNSSSSAHGPAPGFIPGGPNKDFGRSNISPPAGQPAMKSYKDWNTSWPEDSWEITEPAIYYQAAYVRNLAAMMVQEISLPVTYFSPLRARALAKTVLLEWRVAQEIDADFYAVEYFNDRDEWQEIGRVAATGLERYQFVHPTPREGINEYRLRQTDLDGSYDLTEVVSVRFTDRYTNIQLFPNPGVRNQNVRMQNLPVGSELRMYNANGRLLYRQFLTLSRLELPTAGLPAGWYSVELLQGREGVVWQQKVILE